MSRQTGFIAAALLALTTAVHAQAPNIIAIGSPITYSGANAPDTYSANSTFSSTPVLVAGGKVRIWQEQVVTGPNGEWNIFRMETVDGGPLAGNPAAEWNIVIAYTLTKAAIFDGTFFQFAVSGTPSGPVNNNLALCCATTSVPVLGGHGFYNPGSGTTFPAGTQNNWQQIFSRSYTTLGVGGINVNEVNQFTFGLHFSLPLGPPSVSAVISAGGFGAFPAVAPGS